MDGSHQGDQVSVCHIFQEDIADVIASDHATFEHGESSLGPDVLVK